MYGIASKNGYTEIIKGIKIKTIAYGEKTLMTEFVIAAGAELPAHTHTHEQTGYLVKGRIKLFIGDEGRDLGPGDSWCIPSDLPHRAEIMEDSVAIEVFSPYREDYGQYINEEDIR